MKNLYHVRSKHPEAARQLGSKASHRPTDAFSATLPCPQHCDEAVSQSLHQFAESLGNAIDAKDPHTSCHSEEVAVVAQAIGQKLGLTCREADILHIAGHLHDIGKIGVPDRVLRKQGPLNEEEMHLIRQHPAIGANIVQPVQAFSKMTGIRAMILHHHERYDGKGYPYGLAGNAIPRGARIIAVADSLSAMLQNRPYRKAMSFDEAMDELKQCSGYQFDPLVVQAALATQQHIHDLTAMLKDSDHAAACLTMPL